MNEDNRLVGVWVALGVLLGMLVGAATSGLVWADSHHAVACVLAGGAACGGTITLTLLIINTLRGH